MNSCTEGIWRETLQRTRQTLKLDDGLVNLGRPGHTAEGSLAAEAHEGRATAAYYAVATALGELPKAEGLAILQAIAELQIKDDESEFRGGFRWYREETRVNDSNAAFFILMPLVTLSLHLEDRIPTAHLPLLNRMLDGGADWFAHELREPILYYPNKIMSDGALLLGISRLRGLRDHYEAGVRFYTKWADYTARRGWGWGENASLTYIQIMLNALQIACRSLEEKDAALRARLQDVMKELLAYVRFHDGYEWVPSIRSYNFEGQVHPWSFLWSLAGVQREEWAAEKTLGDLWSVGSYLLFEKELAAVQDSEPIAQPVPRSRTERIMDDSAATTWVGRTGRIGSVNRFPVIAGSYQWPTWGLAWQSYPVSLAVDGEQVAFLRWHVHDGDKVRLHPAAYKNAYLSPALFRESWYPDTQLRAAQKQHMLLAVRSMSEVHNQAGEIADEWVVHRWQGELTVAMDGGGRTWTVLQYPQAAVCIAPLQGIRCGELERKAQQLEPVQDGDVLRLRQVLYAGKVQTIHQPRLEAGWAILYLDEAGDLARVREELKSYRLQESSYIDGEVPRTSYTEIRRTVLYHQERKQVELTIDPHRMEAP
ncbi:hypothetical protein ABE504_14680 [Paenibacillus oryzisoli]|uniref:hypothetical protein n=1 Tax=Paenibacillus oryzisoli TaxID=1850517 RepID=UPI003D27A88D